MWKITSRRFITRSKTKTPLSYGSFWTICRVKNPIVVRFLRCPWPSKAPERKRSAIFPRHPKETLRLRSRPSIRTLGFRTAKIMASRGAREGNNALTKVKSPIDREGSTRFLLGSSSDHQLAQRERTFTVRVETQLLARSLRHIDRRVSPIGTRNRSRVEKKNDVRVRFSNTKFTRIFPSAFVLDIEN